MEIPILPPAGNEPAYPINFFLNPAGESGLPCIQGTPGLTDYVQLAASVEVRGMWDMDGTLYLVGGNAVYTYNGTTKTTCTGTLSTSTGRVWMKDDGTNVMIVDDSGYGYTVTGTTVTAISDTDFPTAQGLDYMDGYFLTVEKNTGNLFMSAYKDPTSWSALEYTEANTEPDDAEVPLVDHREVHVFGKKTVEVYYNSGAADFTFDRISAGHQEVGIGAIHSSAKGDNSYFWFSDLRQVLRAAGVGGTPKVVSTRELEKKFQGYATVSDAFGYCMVFAGFTWYVLTFPTQNITWVYNATTDRWHQWSSYPTVTSLLRHRSNCYVYFQGKHLIGDFEDGWVYEVSQSTYSDDSQIIRSVLTIGPIYKAGQDIIHNRLRVQFKAGVGLSTGQATGTAVMSSGAVASVTIVTGGSGYTDTPKVVFSDGGGGTGAYATAILTAGVVTGITIVAGGSGYLSTPTVTFVGGTQDPQAMLQWSDNRMRTWSNQHWRSIGKIGEYDFRTIWQRMGRSTQRYYQVIITDAVERVIEGIYLEADLQ